MEAETIKLGIIDRLMKIQSTSALKRMDELITQAHLEARAEESMNSIKKGEGHSIDEFGEENRKWREKFTK